MKAFLAFLAAAQHLSTQDQTVAKDRGGCDYSKAIVQQPPMTHMIHHKSESVDQQGSAELIKLIRKLRWIGMEREAGVVAKALIDRFGRGGVDLSPHPADTD